VQSVQTQQQGKVPELVGHAHFSTLICQCHRHSPTKVNFSVSHCSIPWRWLSL